MARLTIKGLHKYYGNVHAVRGVDLDIKDGEFAVFVGPSGCGKSTLLRTIAGLEEVDQGIIEIGGEEVNDLKPRDRNIAMVFQNYALYPHMSVAENIAFGLKARRMNKAEIEVRVKKAADTLDISNLLDRLPRQLSGGQRQRVAIGRAIVRDAQVYLFDEPLSNLDAQLRDEMRGEIKQLHQDLGKTMVYVTHDQVEAMTMADRIVLLKDGLIEQLGEPLELFERPLTRFVAGFLGSPSMNFLDVSLEKEGVRLEDNTLLALPKERLKTLEGTQNTRLIMGVRPEHMVRSREGIQREGLMKIKVTIDLVQPTGSRIFVTFHIGKKPVIAELQAHDVEHHGETMDLLVDMNRVVLIDPKTDKVI